MYNLGIISLIYFPMGALLGLRAFRSVFSRDGANVIRLFKEHNNPKLELFTLGLSRASIFIFALIMSAAWLRIPTIEMLICFGAFTIGWVFIWINLGVNYSRLANSIDDKPVINYVTERTESIPPPLPDPIAS